MKKIKVAWICSFSNAKIRSKLSFRQDFLGRLLGKFSGTFKLKEVDSAIWNTNAIEEFEKIDDVEVHVICPVRHLATKVTEYEENGIHYHFFREQNSHTVRFIFHQLFTKYTSRYKRNRSIIKKFIEEIKPDLVHVMGAENPFYSLALLDVAHDIPTILQLQALLCRLVDVTRVPEEKKSFFYKGILEKELIQRADYIGTRSKVFREYIVKKIKLEAKFVDTRLHMAQMIDISTESKKYDFVYFSAGINKAGSEALEAFILANEKHPGITLDIVGGYEDDFKKRLDDRIQQSGIGGAVTFEGKLPLHEDVIRQIRKARFALLPLKMDFVPNTLHEAMANGLAVVTTRTEGTPGLNKDRQSVLISEQGDFEAMANNMVRLIEEKDLSTMLVHNAVVTEEERDSNRSIAKHWCEIYNDCVKII